MRMEILKNKIKKGDNKVSVSGFDGSDKEDRKDFTKAVIRVVKEDLARPKGAGTSRYQLRIGRKNKRVGLLPQVSTSQGVEKLIIWNIPNENVLKEIVSEITKEVGDSLNIIIYPYLWFSEPPSMLPNESQE